MNLADEISHLNKGFKNIRGQGSLSHNESQFFCGNISLSSDSDGEYECFETFTQHCKQNSKRLKTSNFENLIGNPSKAAVDSASNMTVEFDLLESTNNTVTANENSNRDWNYSQILDIGNKSNVNKEQFCENFVTSSKIIKPLYSDHNERLSNRSMMAELVKFYNNSEINSSHDDILSKTQQNLSDENVMLDIKSVKQGISDHCVPKKYPWEILRENQQKPPQLKNSFKTAGQQMNIEILRKNVTSNSGNLQKRCLGLRRGIKSKFVPPVRRENSDDSSQDEITAVQTVESSAADELMQDKRLKNIDPKMVERILNEIVDDSLNVEWTDIAGLQFAKNTLQEIVVWPMLRPDIFTGLRSPPKGILLFGPPGTGKTMIGKCIASQSGSTFFSISASSLTSKWVGEGEKMVRAMFCVARCRQPSVIFIDEIDSILTQRMDTEHESSRRMKTEFLVQLDGATTSNSDRVLVVGATNRPQELDEAARRRFVKRIHIPLPEQLAREKIVSNLLKNQEHAIEENHLKFIGEQTNGFSGADVASLCREAAMGPIRTMNFDDITNIALDQVRGISVDDFNDALETTRPSVSPDDLDTYEKWNALYGSKIKR